MKNYGTLKTESELVSNFFEARFNVNYFPMPHCTRFIAAVNKKQRQDCGTAWVLDNLNYLEVNDGQTIKLWLKRFEQKTT